MAFYKPKNRRFFSVEYVLAMDRREQGTATIRSQKTSLYKSPYGMCWFRYRQKRGGTLVNNQANRNLMIHSVINGVTP